MKLEVTPELGQRAEGEGGGCAGLGLPWQDASAAAFSLAGFVLSGHHSQTPGDSKDRMGQHLPECPAHSQHYASLTNSDPDRRTEDKENEPPASGREMFPRDSFTPLFS